VVPLADALVATYGFGEPPDCERLVRSSNDLVRIATSGGTFWLKLANKVVRPLDDLESEAEVAADLAARRLAVAAPVLRVDGRYVGTLDLREGRCSAVLFHDAPGEELEAAAPAQAEALGALIAKIHIASPVVGAERRWTIDAETLATRPLGWIAPWLLQAGRDVDALTALSDEMGARIWTRDGTTLLPSGLCHGDLQLENARFVGDAPTLFDFEVCGVGPCVYDLACYWRKRVALAPPDTPRPEDEWKALLRGYARVRSLAAAELRAVPPLATLRAIWTMALPASPQARWGHDWLVDPDYFAAHLDMIQRLADAARDDL
jgi:Ser/Thr protein kinase RdoA (MazF antagonist)